ncbi:MAG: hypothetical protein ACE5JS_13150 [Nitrospinota bacterium]
MEKRLLDLGARLVERDGWWQPESYTSPKAEAEAVQKGAGLFDLSPVTKLDIRATEPSAAWGMIFPGQQTPAGDEIHRATLCDRPSLAARLNPERIFLTASPGAGPAMEAAIRESTAGASVGVTDVTSAISAIELAGPAAVSVLRKLTPVAAPAEDRRAVQARVAGVHAIVFRVDGRVDGTPEGASSSLPAFRLHVSRDLGLYFWEVLEDAGREFGLMPYGTEARSRLFPNVFPG